MIKLKRNKAVQVLLAGVLLHHASTVAAQPASTISVTGQVSFLNPENLKKYNKVWLFKGIGKAKTLVDSVGVKDDGTFKLSISAPVAGLYHLDIMKCQTVDFWSDRDINVATQGYDTANTKIKRTFFPQVESQSAGTQLINTALYQKYLAVQEVFLLGTELHAARDYARSDSAWITYLYANGLLKEKAKFELLRLKQLISANPHNPALVFLLAMLPADREQEFYASTLSQLLEQYPQQEEAQQLQKELLERNAVKNALNKGQVIPHFAYSDTAGKTIDINMYKGKYVLIDFWASWCIPCRKAIPELKALYDRYNASGFDILSVSIDMKIADWKKAMVAENMPWNQVISPGIKKTMADFMIEAIPALYLLDQEGRIVEKYTGFSQKLIDQVNLIFLSK